MKKFHFTSILFVFLVSVAWSQGIVTAAQFFDSVSEQYGRIEDYQAKIVITQGSKVMEGTIFYKKPNLIRINFTNPRDQVIVMDGEMLAVYKQLKQES